VTGYNLTVGGATITQSPVISGTDVTYTHTFVAGSLGTSPVPIVLTAKNSNGNGVPSAPFTFTPIVASIAKYAWIQAKNAVLVDTVNKKISAVPDSTTFNRGFAQSNANKYPTQVVALNTTKTGLTAIRTFRANDTLLADKTGFRVIPVGDYTRAFLFMFQSDSDWPTGGTPSTFMGTWNGSGHMIQSVTTGYMYIGTSGGMNNYAWNFRFLPNKWYAVFQTWTAATGVVGVNVNGVGVGFTGTSSPMTAGPADAVTGIGGLDLAGSWSTNADWLEVFTCNYIVSMANITTELARMSADYGITLN
jgi:hypothetical protein